MGTIYNINAYYEISNVTFDRFTIRYAVSNDSLHFSYTTWGKTAVTYLHAGS